MRTPHDEPVGDPALRPADAGATGPADDQRPPRPVSRAERAKAAERTRRCVLTGERTDPGRLIRLALSPDGLVLPDVLAKAPGRGAWIAVDRAALGKAVASGKLRGALQRAFRTQAVTVPDDLPDRVAAALERATLDRLGLEARASQLLTGSEKIEAAARAGGVALLLHAADARPDGRARLAQAWRVGSDAEGSGRTGIIMPVDRTPLSVAMGRENAVHVAITSVAAAGRVSAILDRWRAYLADDAPDERPVRRAGTDGTDATTTFPGDPASPDPQDAGPADAPADGTADPVADAHAEGLG